MNESVRRADWRAPFGNGGLLIVIGVLLLVSLLTASRSPTVWLDEVVYADPAINLAYHGMFTSAAWSAQTSDAFWAGNPPLYSLLLAGWLKMVPMTLGFLRAFAIIVYGAAVLILWWACRRSELLPPQVAPLFATLMLCGYAVSFAYRSGRPDSVRIFVASLIPLAMTIENRNARLALAAGAAFLLTWSGLEAVTYVALLSFIGLFVFWRNWSFPFALGFGVCMGLAALLSLYYSQGVLDGFFDSVGFQATVGRTDLVRNIVQAYLFDPSTLALLPVLALLPLFWGDLSENTRKIVLLLTIGILITPGFMIVAGKYMIFYNWMTFIPLVVIACLATYRLWNVKRPFAYAVLALCFAASLVGLPARTAVTLLEWNVRDYAKVDNFLTPLVTKQDIVYADYTAYYSVKRNAKDVYVAGYLLAITPRERQCVTLAVMNNQGNAPEFLTKEFGGTWGAVSETFRAVRQQNSLLSGTAGLYELQAFRRTPESQSQLACV